MSPTLLIRRDPTRDYGFTFDTDEDGTVFVWVGHRAQLTDDLLQAINDAYHHHIDALTAAHPDQPRTLPTPAAAWPPRRATAHPIAPRTSSDNHDGDGPGTPGLVAPP